MASGNIAIISHQLSSKEQLHDSCWLLNKLGQSAENCKNTYIAITCPNMYGRVGQRLINNNTFDR